VKQPDHTPRRHPPSPRHFHYNSPLPHAPPRRRSTLSRLGVWVRATERLRRCRTSTTYSRLATRPFATPVKKSAPAPDRYRHRRLLLCRPATIVCQHDAIATPRDKPVPAARLTSPFLGRPPHTHSPPDLLQTTLNLAGHSNKSPSRIVLWHDEFTSGWLRRCFSARAQPHYPLHKCLALRLTTVNGTTSTRRQSGTY